MKAMIFAAGLGTRLKPFTDSHPKALLPLNGKTLLQYQILRLQQVGITDIVINVHHFANQIIDYLAANDNFGCHIFISDETTALLDTGGGLLHAATYLQDDSVLACNVDILSNIDLQSFIATTDPTALATLVVSRRDTQRYLLFDTQRRLRGWTNIRTRQFRPDTLTPEQAALYQSLAFSGMQILSPQIFPLLRQYAEQNGSVFSLIDCYLDFCSHYPLFAFIPQNYRMMDVGKTDQLALAAEFAQEIML